MLNKNTKIKQAVKKAVRVPKKRATAGDRIIEGLEQAIAWTHGENDNARVTVVRVPQVNVRAARTKMRLS